MTRPMNRPKWERCETMVSDDYSVNEGCEHLWRVALCEGRHQLYGYAEEHDGGWVLHLGVDFLHASGGSTPPDEWIDRLATFWGVALPAEATR